EGDARQVGAVDLYRQRFSGLERDVGGQRAVVGIARGIEAIAARRAGDVGLEIGKADAEAGLFGADVRLGIGDRTRDAQADLAVLLRHRIGIERYPAVGRVAALPAGDP